MGKKVSLFLFCCLCLSLNVEAQNITVNATNSTVSVNTTAQSATTYQKQSSRYDYAYQTPRRQSLDAYGRYVRSSSGVRYINSPSRLKNAKHAARIDANNRYYEVY